MDCGCPTAISADPAERASASEVMLNRGHQSLNSSISTANTSSTLEMIVMIRFWISSACHLPRRRHRGSRRRVGCSTGSASICVCASPSSTLAVDLGHQHAAVLVGTLDRGRAGSKLITATGSMAPSRRSQFAPAGFQSCGNRCAPLGQAHLDGHLPIRQREAAPRSVRSRPAWRCGSFATAQRRSRRVRRRSCRAA